jgi:hypothetical protein
MGGMPQVVKEFIKYRRYDLVPVLQKNIDNAYIADMAKYAGKEETVRIMAGFHSVPAQLAKENKKFQYRVIKKGARSAIYETSLAWLRSSGIVISCTRVTHAGFPLSAFADPSSFKIYRADTGLLCANYGLPAHLILAESSYTHAIKGVLSENFVAASLMYNGYTPYYWESPGKAEVDFVIENSMGEVIPIEVKSSQHVRSKSLSQFISRYHPPYAIRISTKNFGFENNIKSVPLYAVFWV